jgi:hypothetical protein
VSAPNNHSRRFGGSPWCTIIPCHHHHPLRWCNRGTIVRSSAATAG